MRRRIQRVETVEFNGIKFRRYPEATRYSDRMYFKPGPADAGRGIQNLHIEIWKSVHGRRVPRGWHVHHLDGDALNNDPANLDAMPGRDHHRLHGRRTRSPERLRVLAEHLERIRPLATEWHRSRAGRR